jgi:hypothetical protein
MQNSGVGGKGGGILQFKCEAPRGGGTPHVSQFNYQRSKPDANNHNIWNPYTGPQRKIEEQPHGVFRRISKA